MHGKEKRQTSEKNENVKDPIAYVLVQAERIIVFHQLEGEVVAGKVPMQ